MPVRRSPNHIPAEEQGIVTILGADCDTNTKSASIRRTLSADMSSKKWLQNNGFFSSPINKIVSSQQIADEGQFKFNQSPNQDEVWRSIQAEKEKHVNENEKKLDNQTGAWGLLLTQKSDNSLLQLQTQAPYIHPMVKRSKSGLSEKSLEVCTESLGSETGSDSFSCPSSDDEERDDNENHHQMLVMQRAEEDPFADLQIRKYKKTPAKPFPPPLSSIAAAGAALHMHSHRQNGRLVVEAVSVAPRKCFHARRDNGRLLLTVNGSPPAEVEESESESESLVVEENLSSVPSASGMHKSGLVVKKMMAVGNINPKWANEEAAQTLPPRPPAARAPPTAAFNAYEYFWRSKPGFMISNKNSKMNQDLVMYMRGCKEARRSLIWEPYCIATS